MVAYEPTSVPSSTFPDTASEPPHTSPRVPLAEQFRYWAAQLDGVTAPELPTDQRPNGALPSVGVHSFALPAEVTAGLLALTAQFSLTLQDLSVAACQILLTR